MGVELSIAFAAVAIAVVAVGVSVWEGASNRRHNRLAVRPLLAFVYRQDETNLGFCLRNVGGGPAVLTFYRITIASSDTTVDMLDDADSLVDIAGLTDPTVWSAGIGDPVAAGAEEPLLMYADVESLTPDAHAAEVEKLSQLVLYVGYESLYGEPATLEFNVETGKSVRSA